MVHRQDDHAGASDAGSAYIFDLLPMLTPGDMDGDGGVGSADVLIFTEVLLGQDGNPMHVGRADVNCSGVADGLDVQEFISHMLN